MLRSTLAALAVSLLLLAPACGDDEASGEAARTTATTAKPAGPSEADARTVAERYWKAALAGDGEAMCRDVAVKTQMIVMRKVGVSDCPPAANEWIRQTPEPIREGLESEYARTRVVGKRAIVTLELTGRVLAEPNYVTLPLEVQGGRWMLRDMMIPDVRADVKMSCLAGGLPKWTAARKAQRFWRRAGHEMWVEYLLRAASGSPARGRARRPGSSGRAARCCCRWTARGSSTCRDGCAARPDRAASRADVPPSSLIRR